jgi:hypothetical protein
LLCYFEVVAVVEINHQVVNEIVDGIYDGFSLTRLLQERRIGRRRFDNYLQQYPELLQSYIRARASFADVTADEILEIADTEPDPQRARNRIDARKWLASKLRPDVYGDRIDLNVNQIVDIKGVLDRARNRSLLPSHDLALNEKAQVIDITTSDNNSVRDLESPVRKLRDANRDWREDIFS